MLFKPFLKFHRITDISVDLLEKYSISALILDVDNTLSTHHGSVLVDGLNDWIANMQDAGIKLLILSNSKQKRVEPFAEKINLDFIPLGLKPLPFGYIKALKRLDAKRKNAAIIGDQLFTDSLGAHLTGIKPFIVEPIKLEPMLSFRIRRKLESFLYKFYKFEV